MSKITSCPVCRGEIHAIAGRCKHCKADLVDLRERASRLARAQAIGATVPPAPRFGLFPQGAPPTRAQGASPTTMRFDGAPTVRDPAPPSWAPPRATEPPPIQGEPADDVRAGEVPEHEPTTAEMEAAYDPAQFAPAAEAFPGPSPAPFHGRRFPGVVPDPTPGGTPPHGIGFARPRARRASSWSRRWPLLVSAVALLAIGISVGVLAERWRQKKARTSTAGERHGALSRSPIQVPDHMPQPLLPGPGEPRLVPDQRDPAARPPADSHAAPAPAPDPPADPPDPEPPDPDPSALPDPSNPGSRFSPPPPGQSGDTAGFRTFSVALTESLCQKLTQCGLLDDSSQSMCRVLAEEMDPEDAAEKVARGECSFNQRAADACLRAVAELSCDGGSGDRMLAWLMAPNKVGQCAEAYVCQ